MTLGIIIFLMLRLALDYWSAKNKFVDGLYCIALSIFFIHLLISAPSNSEKILYALFLIGLGAYTYFRMRKTPNDLFKDDPKSDIQSEDKIRFGYFENFKGHHTLLFFGSAKALAALKEILSSLQPNENVSLENDSRFLALRGAQVTICLSEEPQCGLHYTLPEKPIFKWTISKNKIEHMLAKTSKVISSFRPSHTYLDGELDEAQVLVSRDEYLDTMTPP